MAEGCWFVEQIAGMSKVQLSGVWGHQRENKLRKLESRMIIAGVVRVAL
jgi:hypothetical protein